MGYSFSGNLCGRGDSLERPAYTERSILRRGPREISRPGASGLSLFDLTVRPLPPDGIDKRTVAGHVPYRNPRPLPVLRLRGPLKSFVAERTGLAEIERLRE